MNHPSLKSSVEEIRERFDADVERFTNLETGQSATMDAPLVLELLTATAAAQVPQATTMLDIGCGAGNFTLKMLEQLPNLECGLIDLSGPMLDRAAERLGESTAKKVDRWQCDIRTVELTKSRYDIVVAAAVLHHLRETREWESVFAKIFTSLRPGGIFLVSDLIDFELDSVRKIQTDRYGEYLRQLKGDEYRDQVFAYIAKEDSPRSLAFQTQLAWETGFRQVDILHASACFGAYAAVK